MKTKETTTLPFLTLFILACFALSPILRGQDGAVGPATNGNTAEGTNALHSLTGKATGKDNTAMGFDALFSNTNGIANTSNGSGALKSNTFGIDNTAMGFQALFNNTTGNYNTAVGYQALYSTTVAATNDGGDVF